MATYLDYLSFKAKLKWYKRILFPLFLNDKEYDEYERIVTDEKSDLDCARDVCYYTWEQYAKNPCYENKRNFEFWEDVVKMLLRKQEWDERNNTGRDN